MKKLSELYLESFDSNPGNSLDCLGVSNHYTPINNILIAIRNLICCRLGVIAEPGEDGVSIKLHSSRFIDEESINSVLFDRIDRFTSLDSYIRMQGLTKRTIVDLGAYKVVYYSPEDIKQAENPEAMAQVTDVDIEPTAECLKTIKTILEEQQSEDTNEDTSEDTINWNDILGNEDKNVAAALFYDKIKNKIDLPENYYVKATKDANDNKCVAIRKKYEFRKPFGEKIEKIKSIINIYSPENIWVSGYQDCITLSEIDSSIIEKVLEIINAQKTDDNCTFTLIVKQAEEPQEPQQKEDELENE